MTNDTIRRNAVQLLREVEAAADNLSSTSFHRGVVTGGSHTLAGLRQANDDEDFARARLRTLVDELQQLLHVTTSDDD